MKKAVCRERLIFVFRPRKRYKWDAKVLFVSFEYNITIKPIKTMEHIRETIKIQKAAWDLDDLEVIPTFEMKAISDVGIVLGAFFGEKIIGMIYGYHHFPDRHYSHMMAVLPEWQSKGIGYLLKRTHRELALNSPHNVNYIEWTVDPLLPNNAYLNFAKLGGICRKYYIDYYGDASSFGLYKGLPTDRFLVEWPIRAERVKRRIKHYKEDRVHVDKLLSKSPPINEIKNDKWKEIKKIGTSLERFTVQVPHDFHKLRVEQPQIALDWRLKFREVCLETLSNGWIVVDYHSFIKNHSRINFYEFAREEVLEQNEIFGIKK